MTTTADPPDAAGLADRILADARGGVGDGGRLPTERRLAADLGVSRSSVRNALARLDAAGLLSREVGRGTFLRSGPQRPDNHRADNHRADNHRADNRGADNRGADAPLTDVSPADVMAVRTLLEPQAMALVVTRATARDFAEMDRCLAGGDAAGGYDEFEVWDLALHRCLVRASHNPLLAQLYDAVETARQGQLWGQLKRRRDSAGRRERYCREHHAVVDAVRSRDPDAAVAAMRRHLAGVAANLFGPVL